MNDIEVAKRVCRIVTGSQADPTPFQLARLLDAVDHHGLRLSFVPVGQDADEAPEPIVTGDNSEEATDPSVPAFDDLPVRAVSTAELEPEVVCVFEDPKHATDFELLCDTSHGTKYWRVWDSLESRDVCAGPDLAVVLKNYATYVRDNDLAYPLPERFAGDSFVTFWESGFCFRLTFLGESKFGPKTYVLYELGYLEENVTFYNTGRLVDQAESLEDLLRSQFGGEP